MPDLGITIPPFCASTSAAESPERSKSTEAEKATGNDELFKDINEVKVSPTDDADADESFRREAHEYSAKYDKLEKEFAARPENQPAARDAQRAIDESRRQFEGVIFGIDLTARNADKNLQRAEEIWSERMARNATLFAGKILRKADEEYLGAEALRSKVLDAASKADEVAAEISAATGVAVVKSFFEEMKSHTGVLLAGVEGTLGAVRRRYETTRELVIGPEVAPKIAPKETRVAPKDKSLISIDKQPVDNGDFQGQTLIDSEATNAETNDFAPTPHASAPNSIVLTFDRFDELLRYHPRTGTFTWRVARGSCAKGATAGSPDGASGYIRIGIDGFDHYAHRLAFLAQTEELPPANAIIDHVDGNRQNNAFNNLRLATPSENAANASPKDPAKPKGIEFDEERNRYRARITAKGKTYRSKWFAAEAEAIAARDELEKFHHGEFARDKPCFLALLPGDQN